MCKICDDRHREIAVEELGSKRIKTMLDNCQKITPRQIGTWAYRQGARDMALAVISSENDKSDIDYSI